MPLTPVNAESGVPSTPTEIFNQFISLQIELLDVERDIVKQLRKQGKSSDDVVRKIERELDLEETRLRMDLVER